MKALRVYRTLKGPQISPLRYAPVEMTKGKAVTRKLQISPLRFAPVEMTKGRAGAYQNIGKGDLESAYLIVR